MYTTTRCIVIFIFSAAILLSIKPTNTNAKRSQDYISPGQTSFFVEDTQTCDGGSSTQFGHCPGGTVYVSHQCSTTDIFTSKTRSLSETPFIVDSSQVPVAICEFGACDAPDTRTLLILCAGP
jgi:hypothetical protein